MFLELLDTDEGFKLEVDKAFGIREYVLQVLATMYELKKDNAELMRLVRLMDNEERKRRGRGRGRR